MRCELLLFIDYGNPLHVCDRDVMTFVEYFGTRFPSAMLECTHTGDWSATFVTISGDLSVILNKFDETEVFGNNNIYLLLARIQKYSYSASVCVCVMCSQMDGRLLLNKNPVKQNVDAY